jgi:hypothetical protein
MFSAGIPRGTGPWVGNLPWPKIRHGNHRHFSTIFARREGLDLRII